ncbi:MAG: hypothetical protein AAFQ82_24905, partial [Myxococcota bacterium]
SSVDYHIGAISTDPNDAGRLHEGASEISFITPTTTAPAAVFLENVSVGTRGSPLERGFETMTLALGVGPEWIVGTPPSPPNPGFLRDDAALFVIAVSDEDDESFGPVAYYQRVVESYKGAGNEALVSVSAIASPAGEEPCSDSTRGAANRPAERYAELSSATGGVFVSICSDFSEALSTLSNSAAGLRSVFSLTGAPTLSARLPCPDVAPSAFCVRVTEPGAPGPVSIPEDPLAGWIYDAQRNAVVFGVDAIPTPRSTLTVEYRSSTGGEFQ